MSDLGDGLQLWKVDGHRSEKGEGRAAPVPAPSEKTPG